MKFVFCSNWLWAMLLPHVYSLFPKLLFPEGKQSTDKGEKVLMMPSSFGTMQCSTSSPWTGQTGLKIELNSSIYSTVGVGLLQMVIRPLKFEELIIIQELKKTYPHALLAGDCWHHQVRWLTFFLNISLKF